jgi:hypothetical protein
MNASFFVILLVIFLVLITNNANLTQNILNYTECNTRAGLAFSAPDPSLNTGISQWSYNSANKTCTIQFPINADLKASVHMYIRITNFYQNHQYYVKSQDMGQLRGLLFAIL